MSNEINHPAHYNKGKIEVIEVIEDQNLPYHLGNAIKYILRAGHKINSLTHTDLKKAVWYLNRYIEWTGPGNTVRPNEMDPNWKEDENARKTK